jgi:uncharacterized protein (DUF1697 family)
VFVALMRGVNVGKARRVPMVALRGLLGGLGYTGVTTLLNSGNAVFRAAGGTAGQCAADIGAVLADQLGVEVLVVVKSAADLAAIVAGCPIVPGPAEHARLLVAFAQRADALPALAAGVAPHVVAPERFALGSHAAYLHAATGILGSKAAGALLGKAALSATTRNWATVLKLQALARQVEVSDA